MAVGVRAAPMELETRRGELFGAEHGASLGARKPREHAEKQHGRHQEEGGQHDAREIEIPRSSRLPTDP